MKEMNGSDIQDWCVVWREVKENKMAFKALFYKYRAAKDMYDRQIRLGSIEVELYKLTRSLKHQFKLVPDKAEINRAKKATQPKDPVKGKKK